MSFAGMPQFGGSGAEEAARLEMAKQQMESIAEMYTKMSETCFQKCVAQYNDADLSVGEMSCVDRCVGKYLAVHERVQHKMQSMGEQVSQRM